MREDWTEKYRPRSLSHIIGNVKAVHELRRWAQAWEHGDRRKNALILYGEPGIGKTSSALALANDYNWGVIEMNASDARNADVINRIAKSGAVNETFTDEGEFVSSKEGGRKLIIMDEADNIFGREDRGGMRAIINIIKITNQPIILIANDYYQLTKNTATLKSLCKSIQYKKISRKEMHNYLSKICMSEGINISRDAISKLIENANGDLRCAINDLQSVAQGHETQMIDMEDLTSVGQRDSTISVFDALRKILQTHSADLALRSIRDLDETPESILLWIDENLPREYRALKDLEMGYYYLSRADVFLGRVRRQQYYQFWSYASELMSAGVAVAKGRKYGGWTKYQFPKYLIMMKQSKEIRAIREELMGKLGRYCHTSKNVVKTDLYHHFVQLFKLDREFAPIMINQLDLTPNDIGYIISEEIDSNKVNFLVEEAMVLREKIAKLFPAPENQNNLFSGLPVQEPQKTQPLREQPETPGQVVRPVLPPERDVQPQPWPAAEPLESEEIIPLEHVTPIPPSQESSGEDELIFEDPALKDEQVKKPDKRQRTLFDF